MPSSINKQNAKDEPPAGWRKVRLGDIFNIQTGKSQRDKINKSGKFIVIDMGGVSADGKLIEKKKILYSEHFLQIDDLVMPKDDIGHGYILGKVAIIKKSNKYVLGDHVFRLRNISPNSPDFLRILINSPSINNSLKRKASGTSQKGLTKKEILNHFVLLPDLKKQKQIASIISTWDDAIEKTEHLIATQERQFKGLINALLNDKSKQTNWRRVRLGDIFDIQTGKSQRDKINNSGEFVVIDMGGVSKDGKLIEKKKILSSEYFLQIDDLVMPKDDIGHGYILGKVAIIKKLNKYVLGDHVFALKNISSNIPNFLRILINSPAVNNSLKRKANGTSQKGLTKKEIFNHVVLLPDIKKQKQIASIISTWDDAIERNRTILKKYENQKQGIIQHVFSYKLNEDINL